LTMLAAFARTLAIKAVSDTPYSQRTRTDGNRVSGVLQIARTSHCSRIASGTDSNRRVRTRMHSARHLPRLRQRTSTQTQAPEPLSCDEFLTVPLRLLYTTLSAETICGIEVSGSPSTDGGKPGRPGWIYSKRRLRAR